MKNEHFARETQIGHICKKLTTIVSSPKNCNTALRQTKIGKHGCSKITATYLDKNIENLLNLLQRKITNEYGISSILLNLSTFNACVIQKGIEAYRSHHSSCIISFQIWSKHISSSTKLPNCWIYHHSNYQFWHLFAINILNLRMAAFPASAPVNYQSYSMQSSF